jgi:hypothetical protein
MFYFVCLYFIDGPGENLQSFSLYLHGVSLSINENVGEMIFALNEFKESQSQV